MTALANRHPDDRAWTVVVSTSEALVTTVPAL
jgi:hypothetical protein